jgi:hypothetical protein
MRATAAGLPRKASTKDDLLIPRLRKFSSLHAVITPLFHASLNIHDLADEPVSHELEVRARGRRVPDDGLQLLDLIGAPQHLELVAQRVERRRRL